MGRSKKTQFTGTLAQRIDDTAFDIGLGAWPADSPQFEKAQQERINHLYKLRLDRMPELGRQLGIDVAACNLDTHLGRAALYSLIAIELAVKLEIPGFLLTKPKWPPELVSFADIHGRNRKALGEHNPDLNVCLHIVRVLDPDLARPGRSSEATRRAKTLRNVVLKLRKRLARESHERAALVAKQKKFDAKLKSKKVPPYAGSERLH